MEQNYDVLVLLDKLEDTCPTFVKLSTGDLKDFSVVTLDNTNKTLFFHKFAVEDVNIPLAELIATKGLRQAASETVEVAIKTYRAINNQ